MNKITATEEVSAKNASNQSGGSIIPTNINTEVIGCGTNIFYPNHPDYTYSSKKIVRTTTTVREYNDQGNLVKETETVVEEETLPTTTSPYVSN